MGPGVHRAAAAPVAPQPVEVVPPSSVWACILLALLVAESAAVTCVWVFVQRDDDGSGSDEASVTGVNNSLFDVVAVSWVRLLFFGGVCTLALRPASRTSPEQAGLLQAESESPPPAPKPLGKCVSFAATWFSWFAPMLLASKVVVYSDWDTYLAGGIAIAASFVSSIAVCLILPEAVGGVKKKWIRAAVLWRILRPYFFPRGCANKCRAVVTWIILCCSKACNILAPLALGEAVSKMTHDEKPYKDLALYASLGLGSKLLKELQGVIYIYVKQTAYIQMSEHTFRHIHGLSLEWHLKKQMGMVMRSMDRGTAAADNMVQYLFLYLLPTMIECCVTFVIFYVHFKQPSLAAACLLAFLLYIWVTCSMTAWRRQFREGMNKHDNDFHDRATDSLVNFETVKYFTNEDFECDNFLRSVTKFQKYSVKTQATLSILNGTQQLIIYSCLMTGMVVAAQAVLAKDNGFHVGNFVSVQVYILQLFAPLSVLGTIYNTIVMAFVNMQNLADVLAETPDVPDAAGAEALALPDGGGGAGVPVEFRNVCFQYPSQVGSDVGLKDISFRVPSGQKLAVVGATGSGKTTLSRLLFRFYDVGAGQVLVNGQDVRGVRQRTLRRSIGIVPQDTVLFNDTLRYNIEYGRPGATLEEVETAAKQAQLWPFIERHGFDCRVGERGLRLSGGEKQRVAIARCLLRNPPVIVLDEATSALDSQTESQILSVLQRTEVLGGKTVIAIAHRLSTIRSADQILVMSDGRVVEQGTHEQLRAAEGRYAAMWREQERA